MTTAGSPPLPDSIPHPHYNSLRKNLDTLLGLLADHPATTAEVTPEIHSKNKLGFMYDYFARTRDEVKMLDPSLPDEQQERWRDVVQRCLYGTMLINDQTGRLSKVVSGEEVEEEPEFGEDICTVSTRLVPREALGMVTGRTNGAANGHATNGQTTNCAGAAF